MEREIINGIEYNNLSNVSENIINQHRSMLNDWLKLRSNEFNNAGGVISVNIWSEQRFETIFRNITPELDKRMKIELRAHDLFPLWIESKNMRHLFSPFDLLTDNRPEGFGICAFTKRFKAAQIIVGIEYLNTKDLNQFVTKYVEMGAEFLYFKDFDEIEGKRILGEIKEAEMIYSNNDYPL